MGKGTHRTKDGRTVKKGLYYNINKKREEGRKPRPVGAKGAPSKKDFEDAAKTAKKAGGGIYKMANGGMFVQSKGCGAVDNKRRKPTQLK
tara:strand:- start:527 stop:796 length:270 start_codon:yes stop_codon:yes gene_type:complete